MTNPRKRSRQERALMRRVEELERWVAGETPGTDLTDFPASFRSGIVEKKIESAKTEIDNLRRKLKVGPVL